MATNANFPITFNAFSSAASKEDDGQESWDFCYCYSPPAVFFLIHGLCYDFAIAVVLCSSKSEIATEGKHQSKSLPTCYGIDDLGEERITK